MSSKKSGPSGPDPAIEAQHIENRKINARERVRRIFGEGDEMAMGARNQLYDTTRQASVDLNRRYLDDDAGNTRAQLRARMFGQGLQGGSVDVEQNALVDRNYREGLLGIESEADALRRNLQSSDEAAKFDLLDKIDAGTHGDVAAAEASARLSSSANDALARSRGRTIGNVFQGMANMYPAVDYNRGRAEAAGQFGTPGSTYSRPRSSLGRIFNWG